MGKSVRQRVSDSFHGDESTVQAKEYSQKVYAAWKDISNSLSRSALLIFLLMAVFELLAYQRTSSVISIGTFTLVDAPIVQIVLPAIVAFVIYDGFRLSLRWMRLQWAYNELMKIFAQRQVDNDLDILIAPSLPSLWGIGAISSPKVARKSDKFMAEVNFGVSVTMMFVIPVAFECQAYYRLFQKFGYQNVLLWISMIVTALFGISAAVYVWLETYSD